MYSGSTPEYSCRTIRRVRRDLSLLKRRPRWTFHGRCRYSTDGSLSASAADIRVRRQGQVGRKRPISGIEKRLIGRYTPPTVGVSPFDRYGYVASSRGGSPSSTRVCFARFRGRCFRYVQFHLKRRGLFRGRLSSHPTLVAEQRPQTGHTAGKMLSVHC